MRAPEHELDMHHPHQSFATRKRMLTFDGDASNQVIWFTDARPTRMADQTPLALEVIDEWMAKMRANPAGGAAANKPARAVDSCFATDGSLIHAGEHAWDGILDSLEAGPCTQAFPLFSTSRIVSGGPIEGGIFKCAMKPVETAVVDGTYAPWTPDAGQREALERIFPAGVCDYSKPDVGLPVGW